MTVTNPQGGPVFEAQGWFAHRLIDDHVMDDQFKHYLGNMFFGMTDLGECMEVARHIRPGDEESWITAWSNTARRLQERAEESDRKGKRVSAASAYLRASSYWRASLLHFAFRDDPRVREHSVIAYKCYDRYLELSGYPGEYLEIPYEKSFLPAYLYRAPDAGDAAPLLIFNQGRDAWPEDTRWVYDGAIKRGIHCLAVHGPGQGLGLRLNDLTFRPDWENVVIPTVDFALGIPGVDTERIGLMGLSFGGYLAPRAAAFEKRIKLCVANPGVLNWGAPMLEHLPPDLLTAYQAGPEMFNEVFKTVITMSTDFDWYSRDMMWKTGAASPYEMFEQQIACNTEPYVDQISCEMLIMDGAQELYSAGEAQRLFDGLKGEKTYMFFDMESTAAWHCQSGAAGLAGESLFDWLDERL